MVGRPGYVPKKIDRAVWEQMDKEDVGHCFKCGIKIDKYWHIEGKEMSLCGPHFFKRK